MQFFAQLYWQIPAGIYVGMDSEVVDQNKWNIIIY